MLFLAHTRTHPQQGLVGSVPPEHFFFEKNSDFGETKI